MHVFLGPFHPHLEEALAGEIRRERSKDRLSPLLVLVPSDALRRRIKTLVAAEQGLHLMNFQVQTFFQLSCILLEEHQKSAGFTLRSEPFMEEALRRVVAARKSAVSFSPMMDNDGTCGALWQSLRDLKDGLVDPDTALEALEEGHFAPQDETGLRELFEIYREVRARFAEWGANDYGDLDVRVEPLVGSSRYLAHFAHIYAYGFYDLTQSQLEVFRAIARNFPVALFYPLIQSHPGWSFAETFYRRHLGSLAGTGDVVDLAAASPRQGGVLSRGVFADESREAVEGREPEAEDRSSLSGAGCKIVSCSGARDEVLFAAKEILRLVEEEGLEFGEIGVVARVLDPYVPSVKEVFADHAIPFNTSARESLMRFNLNKALLLLIDLRAQDFRRSQVIDLLASPYFTLPREAAVADVEPRPEVWDTLTRSLRITRGLGEWNRLARYVDTGIKLRLANDEDGKPLTVVPDEIRMLLDTVQTLHDRLAGLPHVASWSRLSERWREIVHEFIRVDADETQASEMMAGAIDEIFTGLAALDAVDAKTSLAYFTHALRKEVARASIPVAVENVPGVHCLDVMSARGVPFRALFVMGLNEGVFPRTIREDPFLRDRARRVLETDLGCKVPEKLVAYDEERLLFSLLLGAAGEHLYLIYQRSSLTGRSVAPSWYVGEVQNLLSLAGMPAEIISIPRGVRGKDRVAPFDNTAWMLPSELAVRKALRSEDPAPLIPLSGALPEMYERGVAMIRCLENREDPPGLLDGVIGPLPEFWQRLATRGVSPTGLETYVRCPFQYFARYALQLERLKRPEGLSTLEPVELGKICHEVLRCFYENGGVQLTRMTPAEWRPLLDDAIAQVLRDYEREWPTGYPVEWQVLKQELTNLILLVARADLEELAGSNFRPVACEKDLRAYLDHDWPREIAGLPVHGRLDRIDHDARDRRLRVVDYKLKRSRNPQANDKDLIRSAVRGNNLQPPIYTLLGAEYARTQRIRLEDIEAAFYFIAPEWDEGPLVVRTFPGRLWTETTGAGIRQTIAQILEGLRAGEFFILPGDYCTFCEVSEICRKAHAPSRAKAQGYPPARAIAQMRKGDR